jgi:hypothetical protein
MDLREINLRACRSDVRREIVTCSKKAWKAARRRSSQTLWITSTEFGYARFAFGSYCGDGLRMCTYAYTFAAHVCRALTARSCLHWQPVKRIPAVPGRGSFDWTKVPASTRLDTFYLTGRRDETLQEA